LFRTGAGAFTSTRSPGLARRGAFTHSQPTVVQTNTINPSNIA
jgi:hypothetical protein